MYMRVLHLTIDPLKSRAFEAFYDKNIVPALQKVHGCLSITLVRSAQHNDEFLSVTLWDEQEDAEAFNQSELFQKLLGDVKPYFLDSSEWKIKLSDDYTLDFEPADEEPTIMSYPVVAESDSDIPATDASQMFMRILSVKILPDKIEQVKQFYKDEIVPALKKTTGCRYAYLSESIKEENEVFSVTIWDNKRDAENYERSGLFDEFKEKLKHTFSELHQWKMILDSNYDEKAATSKALNVNYYNIVSGRSFK
ncbi:antibiotic biosynthesis monooxygenase [candidate division KSB1 bacterium]|nr:antibiotic biosynthesis monooxygenase [candidate division KSB1 bacterium]